MPEFIATYDLKETSPDLHGEFIKQAQARGWRRWTVVTDGGRKYWYKLPNTTLSGMFGDKLQAHQSLMETATATRHGSTTATITKSMVIMNGGAVCTSDVKQDHP